MKQLSLFVVCGICAWCILSTIDVRPAHAVKEFKEQFDQKYVKKDSNVAEEKTLAAAVETAKCTVCHEGASKKKRNAYGQELAKLLKKETDKKDTKKIQAALDTVSDVPSDPKDPKSPKFGELIKQGKLPGNGGK